MLKTRSSGNAGSVSRSSSRRGPVLPHLSVIAKICQIEADPEAVAIFFRGPAAITVHVDVVCNGNVVRSSKSRTLMDFEDDVNCLVEVPISSAQYESIVLSNAEYCNADDDRYGTYVRLRLTSVPPDDAPEGTDNTAHHAGESDRIPFIDVLDGVSLPSESPEHPREYDIKLKGKSQAILMVKLWAEPGPTFEGTQAALSSVESITGDEDGDASGNQGSAGQQSKKAQQRALDETALEQVAQQLGIDPVSEPEFLWIAREALETPPPPFWVEVDLGDGPLFQNLRTGAVSEHNPSLAYFVQLTEKERQRIGNAAQRTSGDVAADADDDSEGESSTWIKLGSLDDPEKRYFYNFADKERVDNRDDLPQEAKVVESLPSIVEPYQCVAVVT